MGACLIGNAVMVSIVDAKVFHHEVHKLLSGRLFPGVVGEQVELGGAQIVCSLEDLATSCACWDRARNSRV